MARKRRQAINASDIHPEPFVIYRDDEDKQWIAHSLETDQIGMAQGMPEALCDLFHALVQVQRVASRKARSVTTRAPEEYWEMFKTADKLPKEILEVGFYLATGKWSDERVTIDQLEPTGPASSFRADRRITKALLAAGA